MVGSTRTLPKWPRSRAATGLAVAVIVTVLVAALGAPLTGLALLFGPAEYFSLMVLGLIFAVVLAKGSVLKAIAMIVFGLLLSFSRAASGEARSAIRNTNA